MALTNVIGRCKLHDTIDAVPLFEHTICVNSLFGYNCDCLCIFNKRYREMNVNISNELIFSDAHGAMNHFGVHSLCTRATTAHSFMNIRKMKFISEIFTFLIQSLNEFIELKGGP